MTKRQAENYHNTVLRLQCLGISKDHINTMFRIERTLRRWSEDEYNGLIQRDGEKCDGKPRRYYWTADGNAIQGDLVPDRERGALKRLYAIMTNYPDLFAYHQTDPRGCMLYIVKKSDIPTGEDVGVYYNRGLAVCY